MSFMNLVVDYLFLLIDKDDNVDGWYQVSLKLYKLHTKQKPLKPSKLMHNRVYHKYLKVIQGHIL